MTTPRIKRDRFPSQLRIPAVLLLLAGSVACAVLAAQPMSGSQWGQALTTTVGGAEVLNTTLTVPHWFGSTLDPHHGITYGYNIVGVDPNNCSGADCDVTITVDIIPLNVIVDGQPLNGTDVVAATLASPLFALNDYGSTPFATAPSAFIDFVTAGEAQLKDHEAAGIECEDRRLKSSTNFTD